jgi:hypothetical protein
MNFDELPDGNASTGLTFDKLPDEPSFLQKAGSTIKKFSNTASDVITGVGEAALNVGSGAMSALTVPVNKYIKTAQGIDEAQAQTEAEHKAAATTYQPVTETGKKYAEITSRILGLPFEAAAELFAAPARQMVEQSALGTLIKKAGGDPKLFGQLVETAVTFGGGAKLLEGIAHIPKVVKSGAEATSRGISAKNLEATKRTVPYAQEPVAPETGRTYAPGVPQIPVTSGPVTTNDSVSSRFTTPQDVGLSIRPGNLPNLAKTLVREVLEEKRSQFVNTAEFDQIRREQAGEYKGVEIPNATPVPEATPLLKSTSSFEVPKVSEVIPKNAEVKQEGYWSKTTEATPEVPAVEVKTFDALPDKVDMSETSKVDSLPETPVQAESTLLDVPDSITAESTVPKSTKSLEKFKALGYEEADLAGMSAGQKKVILNQQIENPRTKVETAKEQISEPTIDSAISATLPVSEQPRLRVALKVGDEIASSPVEGGIHAGVPLPKHMQDAWDAGAKIDSGWVDQNGKWYGAEEGKALLTEQLGKEAEQRAKDATTAADVPKVSLKVRLTSPLKSESGNVQIPKQGFYSKLEEVVNAKMRANMPVEQLKKTLVNNGVTVAEVNSVLSGLKGVVSKKQVVDAIVDRGTKFEDVVLGEKSPERWVEYAESNGTTFKALSPETGLLKPTKFEQYVEPGAVEGSYRELFVTAPEGRISSDTQISFNPEKTWQDGHSAYSDIQNPIVRIRFNEREVNEKKILFVEEIQGPSKENQAKMPEVLRDRIYDIGVKKVLSYAKENGFDGVAWTTGEMQANRYDLAKHIKQIEVTSSTSGRDGYTVDAVGVNGNIVIRNKKVKDVEELAGLIGKDLAQKAVSKIDENNYNAIFQNLDLKAGGEGLKRLYDETIPGLVKKYGKEGVQELRIREKAVFEGSDPNKVEYQKTLYSPVTSKTPSSYTFYSDPFGIQAAVASIKNPEVRKLVKEMSTIADDYLGAISTRLGNIDPSIKYALRKFEYTTGRKIGRREKAVLPLIKASEKMSSPDYKLFDTARKNGDAQEIARLGEKYKITKELDTLRLILDDIYAEAKAVGLSVKYREHYHPREVADVAGLLDYLRKTDNWTTIDHVIKNKEAQLKRYLTEEEKVKVINTLLRGYSVGDGVTLTTPGQLKVRSVDKITPELEKFYANSDSALLRYISDLTTAIETRKFFGKGDKDFKFIDLDNSIGAYVLDVMAKKKLTVAQERELTNILKARFNAIGTSGVVGLYKNLSYIDTMGSPLSAITQLGDVAFSMYKYGIASALKSTGKAIIGKSILTRKDLGIEKIAAEFSDKSTMAKAVDSVFNIVGLTKIDSIFKETAINSAFDAAYKKAQTEKGSAELRKDLEPIFGEETAQVLAEFKDGAVTENTKLYVFNKLADLQPIALSEMPIKYLTGGNGRIFYMLKTYTLKMFDVYRNEVFNKINTPGQRIQGIKNLIRLSAYLVVLNTAADSIKDFMLGRPFDLGDTVVDNIFRLGGASRFTIDRARMEGVGTAAAKQILPPFKLIDALTKDIRSLGDEKGFEVTQSIPVFGKLYYWWFGKGAEKAAKQEKQQLKEKYYKQATKDIEKFGDISPATIKEVVEDKRLSEKDKSAIERRIEVGDELVYSVMKMPFEKALITLKHASREDQQKLLEVLDDKYERLSEEDKAKYDPKIDEIIADMKKPKFSIQSLLSSDKES